MGGNFTAVHSSDKPMAQLSEATRLGSERIGKQQGRLSAKLSTYKQKQTKGR